MASDPNRAGVLRRVSSVTLLPRIVALVVVAALTALAIAGHDAVIGTIGMLGVAGTLVWVAFTPQHAVTRARAAAHSR